MFKKHTWIYCLILILVAAALLGTYFLSRGNMKVMFIDSGLKLQDAEVDTEIWKEEFVQKSLEKSYYGYQIPIEFSDVGLSNPYPNLYNFYWTIQLMENFNYPFSKAEIQNDFKKYLNSKITATNNIPEVLDAIYKIELYDLLDYSHEDLKKYENKLLSHFDEEDGLFFFSNKKENINSKLSMTLEIINGYNKLNISIDKEIKEKIKDRCLDLTKNNDLFSINNPVQSLDTGGMVISILKKLGYTNNSLPLEGKEKWIDYINNKYEFFLQSGDMNSILYLSRIIEVDSYFNHKFTVTKQQLDKFFMNNEQMFNIEPLILANAIKVYKDLGYAYPDQEKIINYIEHTINSGFNKNGTVELNLIENYYGIALAKKFNYKFDEKNMENLLVNIYERNVKEDSKISNLEKLESIYYLLASFKVLDVNIMNNGDKEALSKSLDSYLQDINNEDLSQLDRNLSSYYIGLKVKNLINDSISNKLRDKIINYIKIVDKNQTIYKNMKMSKIYTLIEGINFNNKDIKARIINGVKSLAQNGMFKSKYVSKSPDLVSTYQAFDLLDKEGVLTKEFKTLIHKKIRNTLTTNSLTGFNFNSKYLSLESIYYGCLLTSNLSGK
ncbi:hypothetical protein [Paenibacillus sediminis]|uniref:Uncharacterized protein n=1 Tax=Paenibacillus sediminis TaxID=664909 RepID=A0ABS4H185_9BACL|nr:hypothetical protein [Paenibacillus sediminis]MBP1936231.1 hypothetical protein [Paenibacillus sediminis]